MIVSFEGLPGCKKEEIFTALRDRLGLQVHLNHDSQMDRILKQDKDKNIFCYELDRLLRIHQQNSLISNDGQVNLVSSIVAFKDVFLYHLQKKSSFSAYEQEVLQKFYDLLYKPPQYIIYFYGDLKNCYKRHQGRGIVDYDLKEFSELYSQYEWVFDVNNCKIPMFKMNIEDDLELIVNNIQSILDKIQKSD